MAGCFRFRARKVDAAHGVGAILVRGRHPRCSSVAERVVREHNGKVGLPGVRNDHRRSCPLKGELCEFLVVYHRGTQQASWENANSSSKATFSPATPNPRHDESIYIGRLLLGTSLPAYMIYIILENGDGR